MKMEMAEKWDEAHELLDSIIEEDEANSSARKRKIAIFKAQGDRGRTVAELNKYLRVFMSDQEAWMELCDLYIGKEAKSKLQLDNDEGMDTGGKKVEGESHVHSIDIEIQNIV